MEIAIIIILSVAIIFISFKYLRIKKQLQYHQDELKKIKSELNEFTTINSGNIVEIIKDDNVKHNEDENKNDSKRVPENDHIDDKQKTNTKNDDVSNKAKTEKAKREVLSDKPKENLNFQLSKYSNTEKVTKKEAIGIINRSLGFNKLSGTNTNFANINKSKPVWWLNIDPDRFKRELHLILVRPKGFIWITIPKDICYNARQKFRIREDKGLVDLVISAERGNFYLKDVNSGSTGFNFQNYVQGIYK